MRFTGSFQNSNVEQGMMTVDFDIEGKDSMSVLRFGQGIFGFSIMQRLHKNLIAGFDYTNLVYNLNNIDDSKVFIHELWSKSLPKKPQHICPIYWHS